MDLQKIDTTRPYSTVYGNPGVRYEQDGIDYDANGVQVLDINRIILSKESRQPYKTPQVIARIFKIREYDKDRYKVIKYMGGYAIYDTQK